jgi:Skp family chaperone for outer membrane proteins
MKKLFLATLIALGSFTGFSQMKIAHVDLQKVIDTLPSYKNAQKELQSMMAEAEKDLKDLEGAYEKVAQEYDEAMNFNGLVDCNCNESSTRRNGCNGIYIRSSAYSTRL